MKAQKIFNGSTALAFVLLSSLAMALTASEEAELRVAARPMITADDAVLRFDAPPVSGFRVLNLRVFDASGDKVIDRVSRGETLEVFPGDLEDGVYRFESVAVIDKPSWREDESPTVTARNFGEFLISGGRILTPVEQELTLSPSKTDRSGVATRLAAFLLNILVADAAADNVQVSSTLPSISFVDTGYNQAGPDWYIEADMTASTTGTFQIINNTGGNFHDVFNISSSAGPDRIEILGNRIDFMSNRFAMTDTSRLGIGTVSPDYTLHISEANPRIYLYDESTSSNMNFEYAGGSLIIEGDAFQDIVRLYKDAPANSFRIFNNGKTSFGGNVGIGTSDPLASLQINNTNPAIRMVDTSAGAGFIDLRLNTNRLIFEGISGQDLVNFDARAPNASLWLDQSGNLGMGTSSSGPSLQIFRTNGTAQIHVVESSAPAARTLFRLSNAGNTKFEIDETSSGNSWAFTNSGADFRISLQDSGVVEFRVDNNGDAFLAGALTQNSDRNAKQAVVPVDPRDVLKRVVALPISRWQYRDAPGVDHVGPMAQDFHAAFGLGASETGISSIDTGGVALAAIQGLNAEVAELRERNAELEKSVARLLQDQQRLMQVVAGMAQESPRYQAASLESVSD